MDANTTLFGLIGSPVSGSKSPWIHETYFKAAQHNATYLCFDVAPQNFKVAVEGLRALGVGGFNVTIPYKTDILPLLDDIDASAKRLGAVNTVKVINGQLKGYNTDGKGLVQVLNRHLGSLTNKRVLILGAGGAAKGICGALLETDISELSILNRTRPNAQALVTSLEANWGDVAQQVTISLSSYEDDLSRFDLLINTTSVGMSPNQEESPLPPQVHKNQWAVCDIVYKPHETRLIREAKSAGCQIIYGIEMLIEQALLAESIWWSVEMDAFDELRGQLMEAAKGF